MFIVSTPMQEHGKPRLQRDSEGADVVRGELAISFTQSEQYGRMTEIASFHRAGAANAPLHHVELS
ncbi:hypothetical protein [Paraburkholderia aspalathi]|uniref:hypothetical protein n=1 Tax=Paraburkholderia aspalathi TaxID=1324617 RepID=UPI0038B79D8F